MSTPIASQLVDSSLITNHVRLITLDRPDKRNALSQSMIQDLSKELQTASSDPDVHAVILTGCGSFFCAGADLSDIAALDASAARSCRYLENLCLALERFQKPIIVAVNGPALGGGFELALMCDIIVAANNSYFSLPETGKGLIPGAGGTQRLTASAGKYIAMKTILLGKPLTAVEAMACGLVTEVVPQQDLLSASIEMAKVIVQRSPAAIQFAKRAINKADQLCQDGEFERQLYYTTFDSEDKKNSVSRFVAGHR